MTKSFNKGSAGITGDDNSLLFGLMSLILKHWLSWWHFSEDLDDYWLTEDSWGGLMTELFNGESTGITSDNNLLIFEWFSLQFKHRLSQGVLCCLPWFSPVPLLWRRAIPFGRVMMNAIWVCGGVVCLLFCLLVENKRWEPKFWRKNCIHVWVSVQGI